MNRCCDCVFYKPTSEYKGWCKDNREGRKSIRVDAVDFCPNFLAKKEVKHLK